MKDEKQSIENNDNESPPHENMINQTDAQPSSPEMRMQNSQRHLIELKNKKEQKKEEPYVFEINNDGANRPKKFKSNEISTSKYTWWNFLPKNLFFQFTKLSNAYFLLILILQVIKPVSLSKGTPNIILPLSIVVFFSAIKDIVEDVKRSRSDQQENRSKVLSADYTKSKFETTEWQQLKVGQTVKILNDTYFPADIMLLASSEPGGLAYIETKSLDGETNLKHKVSLKGGWEAYTEEQFIHLKGMVESEQPNDKIYKYEGVIKANLDNRPLTESFDKVLSVSDENLLLRGSSLRNTEWVIGIVVFTGHDTKIMRNSSQSRMKVSKIEKITNFQIIFIFILQVAICAFGAVYGTLWEKYKMEETNKYLEITLEYDKPWKNWLSLTFQRFGTWILMFSYFIPISLRVTGEFVKLAQGFFMSWDVDMYDMDKDMPCKVQSSNLNEELGQVSYIFSDKTGTLTQNVMQFKKFSVGKSNYGIDGFNHQPAMLAFNPQMEEENITNVNFDDPEFYQHLTNSSLKNNKKVINFVLSLALCHTIICEEKEGKMHYSASSPDELALVNAARHFGYSFFGRDENSNMKIRFPDGSMHTFKLLNVLEFNSSRKRMSVIISDEEGRIKLICKGADSIIAERLFQNKENKDVFQQTDEYLQNYAKDGLRTLLIAEKLISPEEYVQWSQEYYEASCSLQNRDEKIEAVQENIEKDLMLIGSTAIEDLLQENVGQTISSLKEAGVILWVLTGDKIETAINIGYSCQLLNNSMIEIIIDESSKELIQQALIEAGKVIMSNNREKEVAIIVSGAALLKLAKEGILRETFINITEYAKVVIACRVSPKQKADIVQMIKQKYPEKTTLAIGDGANDVNMITAAHIGVGISGKEGQQATRAADYAIGQFQFLQNLLLVHGRESYRRNSYLNCYMFYKNAIFVMPQFWFGIEAAFSGQTIYEQWQYQLYNIGFTALPIIWFAIMDQEYSRLVLKHNPRLYRNGPKNLLFNAQIFWRWQVYGMCQALLIMFLISRTFDKVLNPHGQTCSFWVVGCIIYLVIVILVNIEVFYQTHNHTIMSTILWLFGIFLYYAMYAIEAQLDIIPTLRSTFWYMWDAPQYYLTIVFFIGAQLAFQCVLTWQSKLYFYIRAKREEIQLRRLESNIKIPKFQAVTPEQTIQKSNVVAQGHHTGFAFSQEPGHVPQIIHNLPVIDPFQLKKFNTMQYQKIDRFPSQAKNEDIPKFRSKAFESMMEVDLQKDQEEKEKSLDNLVLSCEMRQSELVNVEPQIQLNSQRLSVNSPHKRNLRMQQNRTPSQIDDQDNYQLKNEDLNNNNNDDDDDDDDDDDVPHK